MTGAGTIVEFIQGLHGPLSLTSEEGTSAAWLHDLLKPHVSRLVVCDPRKNALLKNGNKSDRIDARKLAELLRGNQLRPIPKTRPEYFSSSDTFFSDAARTIHKNSS